MEITALGINAALGVSNDSGEQATMAIVLWTRLN
jgi:hypothetical protein